MRKLRQKFNLILTLAVMFTMVQTAWAGTKIETRTVTYYLNGGTSGATPQDNWTLVSGGIRLHYNNNAPSDNTIRLDPESNQTNLGKKILRCNGFFEFPNLEGTVKSVAFTNFILAYAGVQMYVGLDKSNNSTLLHLAGNATDYDFSGDSDFSLHSATFEGSQVVSASNPLKIMFSGAPEAEGFFTFVNGTIVITYDVEVEDTTDPGHTFTFATNASSDAIIATCTEGSTNHTCGLTNRQVTMPLVANNVPFDHYRHSASLDQTDFNSAGITDIGAILSYKDKSTNETLDNPPSAIGNYTVTASVTVTYKETAHPFTLTKDFKIYNGVITCNYPQFSFSPKPAIADNDVTITFTPIAGEGVVTLNLTGDKTNMSIGNGITDKHDGTYTFTMVSESLTLDATFSEPDASHFEQTGTDEYTIKTANGWNWFCYALNSGLAPDGFSGKTVKLGTSIESSEMAGKSGHPFKGTFDGQGNTLTFNLQASESNSAPFHYTDGATISNLHVEGTITGGTYESLGGLVGRATGNITISNCHVSTKISTTHSGAAWHGGVIAQWNGTDATCTITGCVYDGQIYNPSEAGVTTSCRGFIGWDYGNNGTITFTDCLSALAAYGTGKYALGDNCFTFVYPNSEPTLTYNMTNCYYTSILGNRQGRPAATATVAPANLGNATTDHGMVDGYKNGFLYDGNYYTPKYGDAVVEYRYDDWNERADVTINGTGENLVGVNITEAVGNIKSVTYNRPFTMGRPSTVMLPFNFTKSDFKKGGSSDALTGHFYEFKGVNGLIPVMEDANEVTEMKANTPYLYIPGETTDYWYIENGGGINIFTEGYGGGTKVTEYEGFELRGTYTEKVWEENDPEIGKAYLIGDGGELLPVTAGTKIRPTECYIIQTAWAQTTITPTPPSQDDDGYYLIGTAAELYGFAELVNNGNATANAKLTADIVVNENVLDANGEAYTGEFVQWTPIGNDYFEGKVYSGTFDGQGHTVSGLYVSGSSWRVGLIGAVSGSAVVKNLGIVDSYFSSFNNLLGSIVGGVANNSSVTLANVYSTSTVKGDNWIGGLAGGGDGSVSVVNSYFAGKTSANFLSGAYNSHHDDLVAGDFNGSTLTVCNAFVLGTSQYGTSVTAGQLSDGTVAAALHYYQDALADGSMFGLSGGKTNFSGTIDGVSVTTANITLHTFTGDTKTYSSKYIVGNTTPLPVNVEREGYTFFGWYDNADFEGDAVTQISSSATDDKEYWAKFERSHSVTFVLNGGSIFKGEIDHYIEGETTVLPTFVTKVGASFEGWYTTEDFTGSRYYSIPSTTTEDMTFYAKWGEEKTTFYLRQGPETVNILYEGENLVWLDETTTERYVISDNFYNYWSPIPDINVPYTGGASTFDHNISEISVAQSGFYVFTLTDMGDESWFMSILKSMLNCDVASIPTQVYTGSAIEPVVTVKDGETTLTLGTDYEVAYSNNVNAGTATVTITGKGNYSDSKEATFTISPRLDRQAGAVYIYQDQNGMTALLDGTSVDPVDIDYNHNIIVNHVTSNRVFTPGMASTVMLPFNYTCNGEEGGTFYKFVGVEKEGNTWVATMQETGNDANNEGTLIANTPYLFMPAVTTMAFPNIPNGGVRLFTRGYGGGTEVTEYDGWELRGTYTEKVWEENDPEIGNAYLIGDGGELIPVTAGTRIRPTECYVLQKKFVYGPLTILEDENGKNVTINGSSVEDIVNCPEFTAQKVTYTRTFTTPKATIVLPFAVSQTDADAAGTFYKFYNVSSEFHVQMQQVKTGGLEAGVPYIVVPKNTTDPVTFETTTPVAFPLTEPSDFTGNSTKWTFNGRYSTRIFNTLDANELVYFFAANEQDNAKLGDFVKVAASETTRILPFRAYIRCADKTALTRGNGVTRGFPTTLPVYAIGNDGNETTQIGTISIEMDDDDWYSLDGRKLSGKPNKKGLYIHKGKKVAIK